MAARISVVSLLTLTSLLGLSTVFSSAPAYDLIIKNGRVVDGSGRHGFKADVAIKGNRIARIGNLRGANAKRVIDARGQIVAPGFSDIRGQSETVVLMVQGAMR